jgi:hypothetical protein
VVKKNFWGIVLITKKFPKNGKQIDASNIIKTF